MAEGEKPCDCAEQETAMVTTGCCNGGYRRGLWHVPTGHVVGSKKELPQVPTTEAEPFCSCEK